MAETSFYWGGTTIGDATLSPYDNDEFSDIWRKLFQRDRATQGPIDGYENELAVSNPAGLTIRVPSGAALVDGKFYENDANIDTVLVAPVVLTRIDRVVLRKLWGAQTVRVFIITGVEGAGVPALTQVDGNTWDVPLAQVSITTGSVVTITSEVAFSRTPLADETAGSLIHIQTITGDGSSPNIDFVGISGVYRHLYIIGQIRQDGAAVDADVNVRINNDSGNNYHEAAIFGVNVTPTATALASQSEARVGTYPGANAIADYVGQIVMDIPYYSDTSLFKSWTGQFSSIPNATVADYDMGDFGGIWLDASAITRVTFIASSGNFDAGTEISLYGVM